MAAAVGRAAAARVDAELRSRGQRGGVRGAGRRDRGARAAAATRAIRDRSPLELLRAARLPALERLAIDSQYDWYVGWDTADIAALWAASGLPRVRHAELRYCALGDALLRGLARSPWAGQIERLELPGTEFDAETAAILVAARPHLARLRELWCFRPYELDEASWAALCTTFAVRTPN